MTSKAQERERFMLALGNALPTVAPALIAQHGRTLMMLASRHGTVQEGACNGCPEQSWPASMISYAELSKRQEAFEQSLDKREKQIETRIAKICAELGVPVQFGGDPRGYTVRLMFGNGDYNTWGGRESGYGVPQ